jgi:hypothetical protein
MDEDNIHTNREPADAEPVAVEGAQPENYMSIAPGAKAQPAPIRCSRCGEPAKIAWVECSECARPELSARVEELEAQLAEALQQRDAADEPADLAEHEARQRAPAYLRERQLSAALGLARERCAELEAQLAAESRRL